MAKIGRVQEVAVSDLVPYERNAKQHPQDQVEKIAASIREFGFLSPLLIDENKNVIAGHGRIEAAKLLGIKKVPCVDISGLSDEQRRAYILADNRLAELGGWDMEAVQLELFDLDLSSFDVELTGFELQNNGADWFKSRERFDSEREEGNDEYNEFLDKFENPKTTDDCYTPDNIFNVVAEYVEKTYGKDRKKFVRPFYPGGDYQNEKYPPGSVVVDNPPFSILAQIVDFYLERNQPFFIFSPGLACLNYISREGVTAICTFAGITYENGASVVTSFVTNLGPDGVAAIADPDLYEELKRENDINEKLLRKSLPKYEFPFEVLTAAKMGYLAKYGQRLEIKRSESVYIRSLDAMKEKDKGIYGGALLLSERAAAERAAAELWELSDREKQIVKDLGRSE